MFRTRPSRAWLWLLLAAALFMRAFLPQGYMPARTGSGEITVRVCGAGHIVQIPTGKQQAPGKAERAEPPCAFAGLGTPALPPPAVAELPAREPADELFADAGGTVLSLAVPLAHPPARGPPPAA